MKITLLIPTMNELEGMKVIMPRIKKDWVDEILVVDGGNDGTFEYSLKEGYRAIRQKSRGLPDAYREGIKAATGDIVVTFSPDGNSIPELIPDLVEKMRQGYDMVIVSRYLDGAKSADDDIVTAFGNKLFTGMINILFGGNYTDSLVMFRAWRKEVFNLIQIDAGRAGIEPHLSILCAKYRLKTGEIPGDEPARIHGIRKMSPILNGLGILWLMLRERILPRNRQLQKARL